MAGSNRIRLPSSGAGLTSFSDESKSLIMLKPMHVVLLIILIIIVEVFLYTQGNLLFG